MAKWPTDPEITRHESGLTSEVAAVGNLVSGVNYWSWSVCDAHGWLQARGIAGTRWGARRRTRSAVRHYLRNSR